MRFFRSLTFRYKIIFLSSFITILSLTTMWQISSRLFSSAFLDSTKKQTTVTLDLMNQNLNLLIDRSETYIRLLSIDSNIQNALNEYLENDKNNYSYRSLSTSLGKITGGTFAPTSEMIGYIVYSNNNIICSNSILMSENEISDLLPEDYLSEINRKNTPVWQSNLHNIDYRQNGLHIKNEKHNSNIVTLSKKIIDKSNGKQLGILILLMDENGFSELYAGKESVYYLVNQDGHIVSCADKSLLNSSILDIFQLTPMQFQEIKDNSNIILNNQQNSFMLTSVHNKALNWDLILYTDLSTFTERQSDIAHFLLLLLLLTIIIMIFVTWISATAITKPISLLVNVMKQYDGSHPALRVPSGISREIDILGTSYNQLLDKVEDNIEQITLIQQQQRKSELQLLQEQIRPHFLYNTLQTTASLIQLGLYKESVENLYALSDFYKQCLSSGKELITLREEFQIIENYLKIQQTRYIDRFDYSVELDSSIQSILIPKLTLQPLVENAIYHGLKPLTKKGTLLITGYLSNESAVIEIMDTGVGISEDKKMQILSTPSESTSFGIKNIIERMKLFYGNAFSFDIDSKKNEYTTMIIKLHHSVTKGETK